MADALPRLSIFNLIRRSFRIYRQRAMFFIGISIMGPVLAAVYPLLFWIYRTDAGTRQQLIPSWLPTIIGTVVATTLMLLGSMLSSAMVVRSVADMKDFPQTSPPQQQTPIRIWSVAGIVFSVLMRLLVPGILFAIAGAGVLAVAAALGFNSPAVAGATGFAVAGGWLLGIILSSIRIYARYAVAIQSCILERVGRRAAMKRSEVLTTDDRGRVSALYSAFMIVSCAIVLGQFMLLPRADEIAKCIVEAFAAILAGAVAAPFWTIGIALIYCDESEQERATTA
jgi:hypothetical protein